MGLFCVSLNDCFAIVLLLDYDFFRLEADEFKNAHSFKCKGLYHSFFAYVSHKYSTKFTFFQYTAAFICYFTHFKQKIFY